MILWTSSIDDDQETMDDMKNKKEGEESSVPW